MSQIHGGACESWVSHKVPHHLRWEGGVMNPKKVYRLMKENKLLHSTALYRRLEFLKTQRCCIGSDM